MKIGWRTIIGIQRSLCERQNRLIKAYLSLKETAFAIKGDRIREILQQINEGPCRDNPLAPDDLRALFEIFRDRGVIASCEGLEDRYLMSKEGYKALGIAMRRWTARAGVRAHQAISEKKEPARAEAVSEPVETRAIEEPTPVVEKPRIVKEPAKRLTKPKSVTKPRAISKQPSRKEEKVVTIEGKQVVLIPSGFQIMTEEGWKPIMMRVDRVKEQGR